MGKGKLERFEKEKRFLAKVNAAYGKLAKMRAVSRIWKKLDAGKNKKGDRAGGLAASVPFF